MTTEQYLEAILNGQTLKKDSEKAKEMQKEKANVEKILRAHFEGSNPTIRYGGSYIKETMIKDSYDLDIICYFKADDNNAGESLEEIFNNVKTALEGEYHVVPKRSALHLESKDPIKFGTNFHIDVAPGRFVDENEEDAFLYQSSGEKKRLKTNLNTHISHISGFNKVIRLVKYWKLLNGIDIKTFVLELLVVKILEGEDDNKLEHCLTKFWRDLLESGQNISIEDPANPEGNDLSGLFDNWARTSLQLSSKGALEAFESENWESIFGEIEEMDNDKKMENIHVIRDKLPEQPSPWCDK